MTKRKNSKKKQKRKHSKQDTNYRLLNTLLAIIIALILVIGFLIYSADTKQLKKANEASKEAIQKVEEKANKEFDKYLEEIEIKKDVFEEYTKHLYEEYIDKEIDEHQEELVKDLDKKEERKATKIKREEPIEIKKVVNIDDKPKAVLSNRPKLAIVIDDVTTQQQLNQINNIGYTITSSLLPPTSRHPNSAKIAKSLPFYMIHFPMQASTFSGEEVGTLRVGDSYEKIEKRVAQIRKWYPNAKYTNNHTGSKFTADYESMDRLFRALIKYDFVFVDSRTTAKTVGKKMAKKYKIPYIVRNVFLDNEQNFAYIQNQLKKAIKIAKKNGYAIAICHPHPITMKVLRESKHLLSDLEMVYLNQIPILNK